MLPWITAWCKAACDTPGGIKFTAAPPRKTTPTIAAWPLTTAMLRALSTIMEVGSWPSSSRARTPSGSPPSMAPNRSSVKCLVNCFVTIDTQRGLPSSDQVICSGSSPVSERTAMEKNGTPSRRLTSAVTLQTNDPSVSGRTSVMAAPLMAEWTTATSESSIKPALVGNTPPPNTSELAQSKISSPKPAGQGLIRKVATRKGLRYHFPLSNHQPSLLWLVRTQALCQVCVRFWKFTSHCPATKRTAIKCALWWIMYAPSSADSRNSVDTLSTVRLRI